MDKFIIQGGEKLRGRVKIEGVKNTILPMMAGSLLAREGETLITNVPKLRDIDVLAKIISGYRAKYEYSPEERSIRIDASALQDGVAPYELVKQMRASFLISGALLARFGHFKVSLPGGCAIGERPINFHLKGFEKLGAKISEEQGYIVCRADKLKGTTVCFDRPSHTGTENLLMAACMAEGETVLENASCEPEVLDFATFLNKMGAEISGIGTPTMRVTGVSEMKATRHHAASDRLLAGTFMMAAAITGGEVELEDVVPENLRIVIAKLEEMGVNFKGSGSGNISVKGPDKLQATDVITLPYPGFPTDLQAPIMAVMSIAKGVSTIRETVFENRFIHAAELRRMGANIRTEGEQALIAGVEKLHGAPVMASDIRAGAGLVLAGLAAEGETVVDRVYHIDRGYDRLEEKLARLGARIRRVSLW